MGGILASEETRVHGGADMVRGMAPRAVPGRFVFRTIDGPGLPADARGAFLEDEGWSVILPAGPGDPPDLVMAQITLGVHSALDGVGLTAAVSGALAQRGIPCNMVAAHHHDHVFVPEARLEEALAALDALAARS